MKEEEQPSGTPPPDEEPQQGRAEADVEGAPESRETSLGEQFEEALREKSQFRAMAQRAQADLLNYRRRAEQERQETARTANSQLLLKLLTAVDDMERAMSLVPEDAVATGWLDGLRLVLRNMVNTLETEGVSKIEAVGRPFDPFEFESVQYEETLEAEEGSVVSVVRDGYRLHDKVLRAAQVIVAKRPQEQLQSETSEKEAE